MQVLDFSFFQVWLLAVCFAQSVYDDWADHTEQSVEDLKGALGCELISLGKLKLNQVGGPSHLGDDLREVR